MKKLMLIALLGATVGSAWGAARGPEHEVGGKSVTDIVAAGKEVLEEPIMSVIGGYNPPATFVIKLENEGIESLEGLSDLVVKARNKDRRARIFVNLEGNPITSIPRDFGIALKNAGTLNVNLEGIDRSLRPKYNFTNKDIGVVLISLGGSSVAAQKELIAQIQDAGIPLFY